MTGRQPDNDEGPLWQRIGWMAAIWAMSVAVLGGVGWVLKLWLGG